jgi:hypothetical protein
MVPAAEVQPSDRELPNELRLIEVNVRDDGIDSSLTEGSAMNHYP